jgi:hypothetical protein
VTLIVWDRVFDPVLHTLTGPTKSFQARHFGHLNFFNQDHYHDGGPALLGLTGGELA